MGNTGNSSKTAYEVKLHNTTQFNLTLIGVNLSQGQWTDVPTNVAAHSSITFVAKNRSTQSDQVQGIAVWSFTDEKKTDHMITLGWDSSGRAINSQLDNVDFPKGGRFAMKSYILEVLNAPINSGSSSDVIELADFTFEVDLKQLK